MARGCWIHRPFHLPRRLPDHNTSDSQNTLFSNRRAEMLAGPEEKSLRAEYWFGVTHQGCLTRIHRNLPFDSLPLIIRCETSFNMKYSIISGGVSGSIEDRRSPCLGNPVWRDRAGSRAFSRFLLCHRALQITYSCGEGGCLNRPNADDAAPSMGTAYWRTSALELPQAHAHTFDPWHP